MPAEVRASRLQLPPGPWATVLDALCARFPAIDRDAWADRMQRGSVRDSRGNLLDAQSLYRVGLEVEYFREVVDEEQIPVVETLLHVDADLVVADKPHFLPVVPSGRYVAETLLVRLVRRLGNSQLAPLHRIDRATAGLVLFSANPATRGNYQALFRECRIVKTYEAVAPALPDLAFPCERHSRLVAGEPFFRMREVEGTANCQTQIEVLERGARHWRYVLSPVTGKKHQLRVHMAALGAPILHDDFYPVLREHAGNDWERPLQLLARSLQFTDPLNGTLRRFESRLDLMRLD